MFKQYAYTAKIKFGIAYLLNNFKVDVFTCSAPHSYASF